MNQLTETKHQNSSCYTQTKAGGWVYVRRFLGGSRRRLMARYDGRQTIVAIDKHRRGGGGPKRSKKRNYFTEQPISRRIVCLSFLCALI